MTDAATFHYDAFISYARRDGADHADRLERELMGRGYSIWRDKRNLDPARDFTGEIEKGIKNASHVVVCITPDTARTTSFVRREIQFALVLNKPVYVARMDEVTPPPIHIINNTWINFAADWDGALTDLCTMLQTPPEQYAAPALPAELDDPYREYVGKVYSRAVDYLNRNIIRQIDLDVEETPDAIPARQQDMFDLLMSDERTQTPFANFAEAFAHFNQRALLLGEPGAGKTVTLMTAARDAAATRLSDPTAPLPVFGLLSVWDASKQTPLADWLGSYDKLLPAESVRQVMTQGEALLLLDGLDEMGSERAEKRPDGTEERYDPRKRFLQTLKAQLGNNHALVTCRIADYATIGDLAALEGAVTLQKLSDPQLRDYLKDLPALLTAIETDSGLNDIARTPLLLSFFAFAFRDRADDLKALEDLREGALRDAIFNAYMDKRYTHEEQRLRRLGEALHFTLPEIKDALGRLAMENVGGAFRRGTFADRHVDNVLESLDFDLVMSQETQHPFIDLGLRLQYLQQREDGTYGFIHLLLRDTLIYGFSLPRLRDQSLYGWAFHPNPALALGAIQDRRAFEPLLKLAEVDKAPADHRSIEEFFQLTFHIGRTHAIDGLGRLGDPRAVEPLIRTLSDPDADVRSHAATALGKLGDTSAVDPLIRVLSDSWSSVRSSAAEALGRLGDPRAVKPLMSLLSDTAWGGSNGRVCDAAARALKRIHTSESLAAVAAWRAQGGDKW